MRLKTSIVFKAFACWPEADYAHYMRCGLQVLLAGVVEGCGRKPNAVSDSCLLGVAEQMNFMAVFNVPHFLCLLLL